MNQEINRMQSEPNYVMQLTNKQTNETRKKKNIDSIEPDILISQILLLYYIFAIAPQILYDIC